MRLTRVEVVWELLLSLLGCWGLSHFITPDIGSWARSRSFYFFLTGLRQSHGAQHYTLGVPRLPQDLVMSGLSLFMLGSMHGVQVSHLHHHRHCLDEDDAEGSTAGLSWWRAILVGPLFPLRLHRTAWRLGSPAKRRWIAAEVVGLLAVLILAIAAPALHALRWHVGAMLIGESMTGFFAVWTVHHGCEPEGLFARTQRGRWVNRLCYGMFFHAEHHLFPAVPTCHLPILAERLDTASAERAGSRSSEVPSFRDIDARRLLQPPAPQKSGIADYSAELLPHLAEHCEIELIVDEGFRPEETRFPVHGHRALPGLLAAGRFDAVLYQLGNNRDYHASIYRSLIDHPGVVVLHEYVIHHLVRELTLFAGDPEATCARCATPMGGRGRRWRRRCVATGVPLDPWSYPLFERAVDASLGVI